MNTIFLEILVNNDLTLRNMSIFSFFGNLNFCSNYFKLGIQNIFMENVRYLVCNLVKRK